MFDLLAILKTVGYLGIFAIVFTETGLLIGLFLPGDSLLFSAGFLASAGYFHIAAVFAAAAFAAILGDSLSYFLGKKYGPKVFTREDSRFLSPRHLERSRAFFEKYGKKSIVLARFLPIVRTIMPLLAGIGRMEYRTFIFYNIAGGILWTGSMSFLGYFLGKTIPHADRYILPIVIAIIIISLLPSAISLLKDRKNMV